MIRNIFIMGMVFMLAACGGGGSNGNPSASDVTTTTMPSATTTTMPSATTTTMPSATTTTMPSATTTTAAATATTTTAVAATTTMPTATTTTASATTTTAAATITTTTSVVTTSTTVQSTTTTTIPTAITEANNKVAYDNAVLPLNNLYKRWNDAALIASATSRIALSGPVANLQSIQRETDALVVAKCLGSAKMFLSSGMNTMIYGYINFMANNFFLQERIDLANKSFTYYQNQLLSQKLCDFSIM